MKGFDAYWSRYKKIIESKGVSLKTLVYFGASWCPHCRTMSPVVDEVVTANGMALSKVDADSQKDIVKEYNIGSLPTIVIMDGNKEIYRKSGALSKSELKRVIEQNK